jgi:hypothetical protein
VSRAVPAKPVRTAKQSATSGKACPRPSLRSLKFMPPLLLRSSREYSESESNASYDRVPLESLNVMPSKTLPSEER